MKPNNKKRQGSLLTRFFKKSAEPQKAKKPSPQAATARAKVTATPKSQEEGAPAAQAMGRSIAEIKQLVAIGKKDPQRLALLVGNMLEDEKERQLAEKRAFDQLLQEIAERNPSG